jgi:hypothetical protein
MQNVFYVLKMSVDIAEPVFAQSRGKNKVHE